jgi:hypothetical protein
MFEGFFAYPYMHLNVLHMVESLICESSDLFSIKYINIMVLSSYIWWNEKQKNTKL